MRICLYVAIPYLSTLFADRCRHARTTNTQKWQSIVIPYVHCDRTGNTPLSYIVTSINLCNFEKSLIAERAPHKQHNFARNIWYKVYNVIYIYVAASWF